MGKTFKEFLKKRSEKPAKFTKADIEKWVGHVPTGPIGTEDMERCMEYILKMLKHKKLRIK